MTDTPKDIAARLGDGALRAADWPERLSEALETSREHVWSQSDCACLAATCAAAMTGVDPAESYRGRYGDYVEGLTLIKADGFRSMKHWADRWWPRTPAAMARRGDWALVRAPADDGRIRYAMAVVDGAALRGSGDTRLPRDAALICWSVG